ncbi:MAG TPA: hypothetical protein VK446_12510 [Methylocystis sp.]|nr:hypothetical protein [Methylocystis sp.]
MKTKIITGATIAASAVALVLAGAAPAAAKHHHHHHKSKAAKNSCNAKGSCKQESAPAEPGK